MVIAQKFRFKQVCAGLKPYGLRCFLRMAVVDEVTVEDDAGEATTLRVELVVAAAGDVDMAEPAGGEIFGGDVVKFVFGVINADAATVFHCDQPSRVEPAVGITGKRRPVLANGRPRDGTSVRPVHVVGIVGAVQPCRTAVGEVVGIEAPLRDAGINDGAPAVGGGRQVLQAVAADKDELGFGRGGFGGRRWRDDRRRKMGGRDGKRRGLPRVLVAEGERGEQGEADGEADKAAIQTGAVSAAAVHAKSGQRCKVGSSAKPIASAKSPIGRLLTYSTSRR